ncbi:MAG: hypothetical protein RIT27_2079 [Pseudomonadota bacterium]|jgi:LasA protease
MLRLKRLLTLFILCVFSQGIFAGNSLPPTNLIQLPYPQGEAWKFTGVHTRTADDDGRTRSSIDFFPQGNLGWGSDTSNQVVVAAHDGTVSRKGDCFVRIDSGLGWSTNYYHLDKVSVLRGQAVKKNQPMAILANNQNQAMCTSTKKDLAGPFPHVHFSVLINDGSYPDEGYFPLNGVTIGGYLVHDLATKNYGSGAYNSDIM